MLCRANVAQAEERPADSAALFLDAARAEPEAEPRARMLIAAGIMWQVAERHPDALNAFEEALALNALGPVLTSFARVDRANSLRKLGRGREALADYALAEPHIGADYFLYYSWATTAYELGDYELALEKIAVGRTKQPYAPEFLHLEGLIARDTGDLPTAREKFRDAILISPANPIAKIASRDLLALGPAPGEEAAVTASEDAAR